MEDCTGRHHRRGRTWRVRVERFRRIRRGRDPGAIGPAVGNQRPQHRAGGGCTQQHRPRAGQGGDRAGQDGHGDGPRHLAGDLR